MAPVAAAISAKSFGATKLARWRPRPQSIRWPGAAMKPSSDIALFTTTFPFPLPRFAHLPRHSCTARMPRLQSAERLAGDKAGQREHADREEGVADGRQGDS